MAYTDSQKLLFGLKYHDTREICGLLFQYNQFRMYIKFKDTKEYGSGKKVHLYGQEHRCTYNQCLHNRVPNIVLDRYQGYHKLVDLLERGTYKGKYNNAKIYSRLPGTDNFDILHREYDKGKLIKDTVNDPVFDHENKIFDTILKQPGAPDQIFAEIPLFKTIYYTIDHSKGPDGRGWLILHENQPDFL